MKKKLSIKNTDKEYCQFINIKPKTKININIPSLINENQKKI